MRHLAWLPMAVALAVLVAGCAPDADQFSAANRTDAISAFQVGHVAEAKAMFQRALSWNPAEPEALYYMGRIACTEQDWENASYYFQCCIDADPSFPTAREWYLYAEKSSGIIGDKLRFRPIPPQRR
jgi:Tfp pilus assembly protein PilF